MEEGLKELFGTLKSISDVPVLGHGIAETSEGEVFLPNSCFRVKVNGTEKFYLSQKDRVFPNVGEKVVLKIPKFSSEKERKLCACHWAKAE